MSSNPVARQKEAPTLAQTDEALDKFVHDYMKTGDANDVLYAVEASHDYDPGPGLEKIRAPLLAINFADDLINPPELGILEREIKRVPNGRALTIPLSDQTRGHGSHTLAVLWKADLLVLLKRSAHSLHVIRGKIRQAPRLDSKSATCRGCHLSRLRARKAAENRLKSACWPIA